MDDASGPCRRVNPAMGRGLEILEDNNGKVVFVNRLGKFGAKKKKKKKCSAFRPHTDAVSGIDNM